MSRTARSIRLLALTLAVAVLVTAASDAGRSAPRTLPSPTVTELTGGVTPGFSRDTDPDGVVVGPDGHIWFTEFCGPGGCSFDHLGPGGVGRVNDDGSVTELVGGKAPGFSAESGPDGIASAGGHVWIGECSDPGRLGEVIDGGKVSEMTGGVRAGFAVDSVTCSEGSMTTARDGRVWFTGYADPGRVGEVVDGTVHPLVGGVTPGFSANRGPLNITTGRDRRIWFTEGSDPGGIGRVNDDGTVTELTGGVTPGFSKNSHPEGITTGPDGHIWFTEQYGGGVGRVNDDGTITELVRGVTPGFNKDSRPWDITTGPDGHVWFTEYNAGAPGRLARINDDGTVSEFAAGATAGFSADAGPTGITAGPDGRLWFAEYDRGGIGAMTVGPRVATGAADKIGPTAATVHGTVRPNAQQTVFRFEYGKTTAYATETATAAAGSGAVGKPVSAALAGLQPGTVYHYRLVATNDTDTAVGPDRTFTTKASSGSSGADTKAPSAPVHLSGRFAAGTLRLSWAPATDNVGVDHYRLYRDGRPLEEAMPANTRRSALRRFVTRRRTALSVYAFDAAGNRGPAASLAVIPRARPKGVPRPVPTWAVRLLVFQAHGEHGTRPKTPARFPAWYPRWKAWRLAPYRITTGR
ncbi:MAG TPA: hypothetical protein VGQ38_14495 [Gaiellaceae bacterium]|jgi:streptogramin lyase|nr:hypothetical protein [Gaiellaceae bacterium]